MNQRFEAGQFITFVYRPPARPEKRPRQVTQLVRQPDGTTKQVTQLVAVKPEPPSDPNKSVLVLNPDWEHELHGIDLKRMTPAEVQTLKAILDPEVKAAVDRGEWPVKGCPPYLIVRDVLTRMNPLEVIKNPIQAYQMLVKPFIRNKDCYRRYKAAYISGVKVVVESHVQGQVTNPAPAFGKPLFKKI